MSEQVFIAILGFFAIGIPAMLNAILNAKLAKARLQLDEQTAQINNQATLLKNQGDEQARLAATATRLAEEAKDRIEARKAEREADRLAQQDASQRLKEAADYYQKRWEDEAKTTNDQRTEIKGLTQQAIDAIKANDKLQRDFSAADRAHTEDIDRLKHKTEDYDKLRAQFDVMSAMLNEAQKHNQDQQTAIHAMNDKFDADIENINKKNGEIVEKLQKRVYALETENDDLKKQIAKLRADLKLVTDAPHQPEPTPPGTKAPIPTDFDPQVKLSKTGTDL